MGLDMYLYSTGVNHRRTMELARARSEEFREWSNGLLDRDEYKPLANLPKTDEGWLDREKMTRGDRDLLARYKSEAVKKAHSLGGIVRRSGSFAYLAKDGEDAPSREIGYWRKEWRLHEYIIENFGNPNSDNLKEVYLDEAAIEKVLKWCGGDAEWGEPFLTALDVVRGGGLVYYYAWY